MKEPAEFSGRIEPVAGCLYDTLREAQALARMIAGRNPHVVRAGKKLLNDAVFSATYGGLVAESNCSRELWGTPNQIEAVMSTLERRLPEFSDL